MSFIPNLIPSVKERVLNCFLSERYGLGHLLRLMDIVESVGVETAAVELVPLPRLLINPEFAREHAPTPEMLFMLVMHELHHILLGHTRMAAFTPLDNLVTDAVINAMLCRMFPEPCYTSLLTEFYGEDRIPACILRPPTGWDPNKAFVLPHVLRARQYRPLAEVYRALYGQWGASYPEIRAALQQCASQESAAEVVLLGDHELLARPPGSSASAPARDDPQTLLTRILQHASRDWPVRPEAQAFCQNVRSTLPVASAPTRTERVGPAPGLENRRALKALLAQAAGLNRSGERTEVAHEQEAIQTPVPCADRRSVVQRAVGYSPLLYQTTVLQQRLFRRSERVHVYVDVSGSIGCLKGVLYGAVLDCCAYVWPVVHVFSTEVHDLSLAEVKKGLCPTTLGTDINCVVAHMRKMRIRRAVIITDGYVGQPSPAHRRYLRGVSLGVALTPGACDPRDLRPYARWWGRLVARFCEGQLSSSKPITWSSTPVAGGQCFFTFCPASSLPIRDHAPVGPDEPAVVSGVSSPCR